MRFCYNYCRNRLKQKQRLPTGEVTKWTELYLLVNVHIVKVCYCQVLSIFRECDSHWSMQTLNNAGDELPITTITMDMTRTMVTVGINCHVDIGAVAAYATAEADRLTIHGWFDGEKGSTLVIDNNNNSTTATDNYSVIAVGGQGPR